MSIGQLDDIDEDEQFDSPEWHALRAVHQQVNTEEREPLVLELPGYAALGVWVRYKYVPLSGRNRKALAKVRKLKDELDQGFWSCVDLLVDACDEILVATSKDDPRADATGLKPLAPPGEPAIRFDRVLATGLQWRDANSVGAREVVRRMFGGDKGDYLIIEQAQQVSDWMGSEVEHARESFAGK